MEIVKGQIVNYDERNRGLIIFVPYSDIDKVCTRKYDEVQVGLADGRTISPEQRRKVYAIFRDIADWQGEHAETVKNILKFEFIVNRMKALEKKMFSLSDCDVTLAREFITFLIEFLLENDIPTKQPMLSLCDDIEKAVYAMLMHKKCVLCGKPADMHHVDAIGMGNDRTEMYQIGMRVVPLCRGHHTEAHSKGIKWLLNDMHVVPIGLTRKIGKVYGLNNRNLIK